METTTMKISNLPMDLLEDIISRIPLKYMRSVRLTCQQFKVLSENPGFTKKHIGKLSTATKDGESQMIVLMDHNLYLMSIALRGGYPSIETKGELTCLNEQVKISQVFHCDGLLLCILKDDARFVIWNPYTGQTRWMRLRYIYRSCGLDTFSYALGYEDKRSCRSHKFLRFIDSYSGDKLSWYEIYDFGSETWRILEVNANWRKPYGHRGVSLKGNTYWFAWEGKSPSGQGIVDHMICFDFTRECFGPIMSTPFRVTYDLMSLSCIGEEKLAALLRPDRNLYKVEIWMTTKIEAGKVLWSRFLKMDAGPHTEILVSVKKGSFFVDEARKVVMVFDESLGCHTVTILGEDGYFRKILVTHRRDVPQSFLSLNISYVKVDPEAPMKTLDMARRVSNVNQSR
ncbi:unnamed protein product [Cochlearia groenlandica]